MATKQRERSVALSGITLQQSVIGVQFTPLSVQSPCDCGFPPTFQRHTDYAVGMLCWCHKHGDTSRHNPRWFDLALTAHFTVCFNVQVTNKSWSLINDRKKKASFLSPILTTIHSHTESQAFKLRTGCQSTVPAWTSWFTDTGPPLTNIYNLMQILKVNWKYAGVFMRSDSWESWSVWHHCPNPAGLLEFYCTAGL